jgi:uncharacterized membrane protein YfcA
MEYAVVSLAALVTSGLTLFSGFGLGTLLMPVFAIFFPIEVAVASTAVVHLFNNLFKLALFVRHARLAVLVRFGAPAILAAFAGAALLTRLSGMARLYVYDMGGAEKHVVPVKIVVALLMIAFALLEVLPALQKMEFAPRYLVVGGVLSGFFGGLSGHQGALRSAFLARSGLTRDAFIGTGVAIACLVDVTRLSVYGRHLVGAGVGGNGALIATATAAAFLGVLVGGRVLKKVTMRTVQQLVSAMLFLLALALGAGLV